MRTVPADLAKRYEAEGWWTEDTIGDLLARGLEAALGAEFRVHSAVRPWSGTFADVEHLARRLAAGLRQRGDGPGDVIAFQLPNWVEAAAVFWAASFLGAVVVPVVHFYGRKELGYILNSVGPRVFIGAATFGRLEYQADLIAAAQVPVVGVVGRDFDDLLADTPMAGVLPTDPAQPALIAFTSGTTRDPKGVIHSHQTLGFETRQLAGVYPPDRGRQLTAAPVGHFIGMVNAFLIPVLDGTPVNLTDVWDPPKVLELMTREDLTVGGGATYYVTSLLDHPDFTEAHLSAMKYAGLGRAPVPAAVTERLHASGITAFRSYGSTEQPSITWSLYNAPAAKRLYTDGSPLEGVEIRLTDEGEILSRGPDLCLGYTDDALTARAFDDDGWYHTGDIGLLDADGYLTITDRTTDLIIRGGENISAQGG
jgi:acyl-CoA synthetase